MSLRPVIVPLHDDLIPRLGRDDTDGRDIVEIEGILVPTRSDGLAKDVGRTEVEPVGFTLDKRGMSA
jgi:hypothetical protein